MVQKMEAEKYQSRLEMEKLRFEMKEMMAFIERQKLNQNQATASAINIKPGSTNLVGLTSTQSPGKVIKVIKIEPLKWPQPCDHTDQANWETTHSLLSYIYKRGVAERELLNPADIFT